MQKSVQQNVISILPFHPSSYVYIYIYHTSDVIPLMLQVLYHVYIPVPGIYQ